MKRRLLVIHPGAIGDVLLARPAMHALRSHYPNHALGLIVRTDVGLLLRACGESDHLFPLESDALAGLLTGAEYVLPTLREWLQTCDLALCWLDDPGGLRATLEACGVAQTIIQSPSACPVGIHQSDGLLAMLAGHRNGTGIEAPLKLPEVIKKSGQAAVHAYGVTSGKMVVVHPGSGSRHKCVAHSLLTTVIEQLQAKGHAVVLVLGPADEERGRNVLDCCATRPIIVRGLDLLSVAGILAQAALFVGHDSGLTHLAAALHIPTLALFGPTSAVRWAPRGRRVTLLSGSSCRCEGWEAVTKCMDKPCLRIAPEQMLAACDVLLSGEPDVGASPLPCSLSSGVLDFENCFSAENKQG